MKKAIRVFVPLVLVLAILGSVFWYFAVYDRPFTRQLMLQQARRFEANGNHKLATMLYDLTYTFANNGEDIALELAMQYKAAGNYTKAEFTLSRAIADGAGAKLYTALCQTYVEQDKLLDAVKMLDNIGDPAIKEALAAQRPAAPTADKESGFYNEYISVLLSSENAKVYVSTDGSFPSTAVAPMTEPMTLGNGVTTLRAVAVNENGMVSPLAIIDFTVGGVVEMVEFTDAALEQEIRDKLSLRSNETIYSDMLWEIESLELPVDVQSYADLRHFPYLKQLAITQAPKDQLSHLTGLNHLQELFISNSAPTEADLTTIAALPKLEKLTLTDCSLSSISPLSAAKELKSLNLQNNTLRNLTPISQLSKLEELYLSHNALTELSALSKLSALKVLKVDYNSLTSIEPICGLSSLAELDVSFNALESLSNIDKLSHLRIFSCQANEIADVSKLGSCTELVELNISENKVTDITALNELKRLQSFDFSYNQATALPAFESDYALVTINGAYNAITSLDSLTKMENLNNVLMDYNPELESVEPLKDCHKLILVNVYGTLVKDVSFLTSQSVIVNFNPTLD